VAAMLSDILAKERESGSELTARELDVLRLVVEGKTNDQIGVNLGISVKTVENHLHTIFQKMNVISRVEAAVRAVRESIV
jgi:two-component system, NarL family, response regulator LiaR